MTLQFCGDPAPLRIFDYSRAAARLRCPVEAIRAVAAIESAGRGFLRDGRVKVLFERHVFHRETGGRFDRSHPRVSASHAGGYRGGSLEHDRLAEALSLDRRAALRSASWGKFQIMGFNHARAGVADLEGFIALMVSGEPAQLDGFVGYIENCGLADALRRRDWAAFARGYNGPGYAIRGYDRRLEQACARFAAHVPHPFLQSGARGSAVARLQRLIGVDDDGVFGSRTRAALIAYQEGHGLSPDGKVGPATWRSLLAV